VGTGSRGDSTLHILLRCGGAVKAGNRKNQARATLGTPEGRLFAFEPIRARAIRSRLDGNTSNAGSQRIELGAFGPLPRNEQSPPHPR